jgi:hypothetical protein
MALTIGTQRWRDLGSRVLPMTFEAAPDALTLLVVIRKKQIPFEMPTSSCSELLKPIFVMQPAVDGPRYDSAILRNAMPLRLNLCF